MTTLLIILLGINVMLLFVNIARLYIVDNFEDAAKVWKMIIVNVVGVAACIIGLVI